MTRGGDSSSGVPATAYPQSPVKKTSTKKVNDWITRRAAEDPNFVVERNSKRAAAARDRRAKSAIERAAVKATATVTATKAVAAMLAAGQHAAMGGVESGGDDVDASSSNMATCVTGESASEDSTSLTDKQERVRQVLWHCLKDPPRVEITVGPGVLRVAARFTTTSIGVHFHNVESSTEEIAITANLDPATVEVNLEQLVSLAGLDSIEEASYMWDCIKQEVSSAPSDGGSTDAADSALAAPEQEPSPTDQDQTITDEAARSHELTHTLPGIDNGETELAPPSATDVATSQTTQFTEGSILHQRLLTTAMDVRLAALHARLIKYEHAYEIAERIAASQELSTSSTMQLKIAASKKAFLAVKRVKQALRSDWAHNSTDFLNITTWFVQHLFGDTGLENLYQCISQSSQAGQSFMSKADVSNSGRPIDMMDELSQGYQNFTESGGALGDTYLKRFQFGTYFQEQHNALWSKFFQDDSTERRALLLQSKDEDFLTTSEANDLTVNNRRIMYLAWQWIERKTGDTQDTIVRHLWVIRHLKAITQVLGFGVLYFMDKRLETQLEALTCGRGVVVSFMKTVEATIGKELQEVCEQGQAAVLLKSTDPRSVLRNIRAQLEKIADDPSGHIVSKTAGLLEDIKHGRIDIPIYREDHDDEVADNDLGPLHVSENGHANGQSDLGGAADIQETKSADRATEMSHHKSRDGRFASQDEAQIEVSASQSGKRKRQDDNRGEDDAIEGKKKKKVKLTLKPKVSGEGDTPEGKKQKKTKGKGPDEDDTSEKKKQKKTKGKVPDEEDRSEGKKQKKTKVRVSNRSPKKDPKKDTKKGSKESV